VTIRDTLTPDELIEGKVDIPPPGRAAAPALLPVETSILPLKRFYFVLGVGPRDRPGPLTTAELPLDVLPDPPGGVEASVTAAQVSVSWEPSGGVVGFLFEHALLPETSPAEDFAVVPPPATGRAQPAPAGPTRYNVYRDPPPASPAAAGPAAASKWSAVPAEPLNATPLLTTTFNDAVAFGQRRCYTVRAVRGAAPNVIESEPSPPACVTPVDRFPPAPPSALAAVAAEGAISLIWEPNAEPDLAGYIVLRGKVGDATLQRLSSTLVTEARYRDISVVPGTRYVYAVVAVDTAKPAPNVSKESLRVEETAR
jgi:hypothetical protein